MAYKHTYTEILKQADRLTLGDIFSKKSQFEFRTFKYYKSVKKLMSKVFMKLILSSYKDSRIKIYLRTRIKYKNVQAKMQVIKVFYYSLFNWSFEIA